MKKILNYLVILFLIILTLLIFVYRIDVSNAIKESFLIFKNNIFINMFPFLIISSLLINYGFVNLCSNIFNPIMKKVFKVNGASSFVFFMSILSGSPGNAKYVKELYDKNIISSEESTKILMFFHFANPLFIIGICFNYFENDAYKILFSHYITNIVIGLLFRNQYVCSNSNKIDLNPKKLGKVLKEAIVSAIDTLFLIFGTITVFLILTSLIDQIFNFNIYFNSLIGGILEMTQGINNIISLTLNYSFKAVLITMFLSFGGISIHTQVMSILDGTGVKYMPYLVARLLHAAISGLIIYFII